MTNREFFAEIAATESLPLAIREHAEGEIAKLDKRNADRAAKPSKTAIANAPVKQAILGILSDKPMTASDVSAALDISVQKASALCRQLVDANLAVVTDVKVPKKGTQKAYSLPKPTEVADSE